MTMLPDVSRREPIPVRPAPKVSVALVFMVFLGLGVWFAPELIARLRYEADQTIAARGFVSCSEPTELEQLHIVVLRREGRIVADCMYVGPKGAYERRPVRREARQ